MAGYKCTLCTLILILLLLCAYRKLKDQERQAQLIKDRLEERKKRKQQQQPGDASQTSNRQSESGVYVVTVNNSLYEPDD